MESSTTHKIVKIVVESSDKDQFSYFYVLNLFLRPGFVQLLNAIHLLVDSKLTNGNAPNIATRYGIRKCPSHKHHIPDNFIPDNANSAHYPGPGISCVMVQTSRAH